MTLLDGLFSDEDFCVTLVTLWEDVPLDDYIRGLEILTPEEQLEERRQLATRIAMDDRWAYFQADVRVRHPTTWTTGRALLGLCSYDSEADFKASNTYHNLVREATADCKRAVLHKLRVALKRAPRAVTIGELLAEVNRFLAGESPERNTVQDP